MEVAGLIETRDGTTGAGKKVNLIVYLAGRTLDLADDLIIKAR